MATSIPAAALPQGDTVNLGESSDTQRSITLTRGGRTGFYPASRNVAKEKTVAFMVFDGFQDPDNGQTTIIEAKGPDGKVYVATRTDHNQSSGGSATFMSAEAEGFGGTQPDSGQATYIGQYAGFLERSATTTHPGLVQSYIHGNTVLNADFGAGTVDGLITGRQRYLTTNGNLVGTMEDINLGQHNIMNGQSVGMGLTTGGKLAGRPNPVGGDLGGEWNVLFGGENAVSAGGTVVIDHNYTQTSIKDDYVETGVFAVSQ